MQNEWSYHVVSYTRGSCWPIRFNNQQTNTTTSSACCTSQYVRNKTPRVGGPHPHNLFIISVGCSPHQAEVVVHKVLPVLSTRSEVDQTHLSCGAEKGRPITRKTVQQSIKKKKQHYCNLLNKLGVEIFGTYSRYIVKNFAVVCCNYQYLGLLVDWVADKTQVIDYSLVRSVIEVIQGFSSIRRRYRVGTEKGRVSLSAAGCMYLARRLTRG